MHLERDILRLCRLGKGSDRFFLGERVDVRILARQVNSLVELSRA